MNTELNPFRDIEFFSATGKFRVNLPYSSAPQTKRPLFDTLKEAIEFRDQILAGHVANKRTRETATYPKYFETRPINV